LLALLFIHRSATIEAVNIFNYMTPLFTLTLPDTSEPLRRTNDKRLRGSDQDVRLSPQPEPDVLGVFCALIGFSSFGRSFFRQFSAC